MGQGLPSFIPPLTFSIDAGTIAYHLVREKFHSSKKGRGSIDDAVAPKKEVTIVISTHGDGGTIEDLVRPVFKQTRPIKNVYICDSNIDNTRGVIERLSREFPNLHYWSKKGLTGKAEKINCLARDPTVDLGDLVYLKDSNAMMAPDVLEKLVAKFLGDNTAAATSFGFVTSPNNYPAKYFHYGKEWVNRTAKFRKTAHEYRRAMFVVCGASFMVRSDILKGIEIPMGTKTEDTAYTWVLQEKGYNVRVAQDAVIQAEDVTTLKSQIRQSYRWYTGTWQNIYLHMKELLRPGSKGNALGYSTVLPGLIETSLYSGTIVSLPIISYFSPDFVEYFLIADTALTLASPLICLSLGGDFREAPREFFKAIRHYHQITTYKIMASVLWIYAGLRVTYDVIFGRSKKWDAKWDRLT